MRGKSETLTEEEQEACECLHKENWPDLYPADDEDVLNNDTPTSPSSFKKYMVASQKRPHSETVLRSNYIDNLSFLNATTVIVESLFSKCSRIMTTNMRHMTPRLFEAIVFLRENNSWWNVELVQEMLVAGLWDPHLSSNYDNETEALEPVEFDDDAPGNGVSEW